MTPREIADEIARRPDFWPVHIEPASHVRRAIQMPLDGRWINGVLTADLRDRGILKAQRTTP